MNKNDDTYGMKIVCFINSMLHIFCCTVSFFETFFKFSFKKKIVMNARDDQNEKRMLFT